MIYQLLQECHLEDKNLCHFFAMNLLEENYYNLKINQDLREAENERDQAAAHKATRRFLSVSVVSLSIIRKPKFFDRKKASMACVIMMSR